MRENDPVVEFPGVECEKETDRALLVTIKGQEHWIPKSHVHDDSEVFSEGDHGKLIISEWIATQKGLKP